MKFNLPGSYYQIFLNWENNLTIIIISAKDTEKEDDTLAEPRTQTFLAVSSVLVSEF